MSEVENEVNSLIEAIKTSKTYCEYDKQRNKVKENPELMQQLNRYREEVFNLQNSDGPDVEKRMDELSDRYADFLDESLVCDFLDAESSLCKMMQRLTDEIIDNLDFE